jgi:hypothetical protein
MKRLFSTKRKIVALGLTSAIILGTAGIAAAYFTSTGTGTGYATVGSVGWGVSVDSVAGGPLFPGSGSEQVNYTVTNTGSSAATLNTVTLTIDSFGGYVVDQNTNSAVTGCAANWFQVVDDSVNYLPESVPAPGGTFLDSSTITMPTDNSDNQNNCQGVFPKFTITAN